MIIRNLEKFARDVIEKLNKFGANFCLVGGIAVSFRTMERTTKDLDLAISVVDDAQAERVVTHLRDSGYKIAQVLEHDLSHRLSTVRLIAPGTPGVLVDLLFASSGIEPEVVATSTPAQMWPGLTTNMATIPSLIALKTLSANMKNRLQDVIDLQYLLEAATNDDMDKAEQLLTLITERGYNRNKDLKRELRTHLSRIDPSDK